MYRNSKYNIRKESLKYTLYYLAYRIYVEFFRSKL